MNKVIIISIILTCNIVNAQTSGCFDPIACNYLSSDEDCFYDNYMVDTVITYNAYNWNDSIYTFSTVDTIHYRSFVMNNIYEDNAPSGSFSEVSMNYEGDMFAYGNNYNAGNDGYVIIKEYWNGSYYTHSVINDDTN